MACDEKLCNEKHQNIKEALEDHEKRLNNHSRRIDALEQGQTEFKVEIKNLCENLKSLTSVMRWFIGIWVTSLLGFFFFMIQSKFK